MLKTKTLPLVLCALSLTACSKVTGVFDSKKEERILEGERISVLQLQKSLVADTPLKEGERFALPNAWENKAWPQAGGYPNHSMQNLALQTQSGELKKIWSANIGRGSTRELPLTAQPIVADGRAFTLDTKSKLSAINIENGKRIWSISVKSDDEDDPVIGGGIAYAHKMLFVTNGYDEIISVSPETGDIMWRKTLPSPSRAAPTILSGRVYISTVDSRLVALDAKDGSSIWEYTGIGETAGLLGAASPGANKDIVVPVFSSGEITALRVENGSVAWSDNLSNVRRFGGGLESMSDITAMPVLDQGLVIAMSFGGKLVAIDERTGTRIWQREISGSKTPWITGNTLFVLSSENQLICMNILDGAIFWITELPRFEDEEDKEDPIHWTAPVLANGRLVLASSHGYLTEVNPHTGDVLSQIRTKKNVQVSPIIAGNTLYLLSNDGTLIAYR
ncbi:MAG: outer membrane protein assembly factor BamB family protein [Alcanivorax sp.]